MLQHIATGWPNVRNMLCPAMLQDVASVWPGLKELGRQLQRKRPIKIALR